MTAKTLRRHARENATLAGHEIGRFRYVGEVMGVIPAWEAECSRCHEDVQVWTGETWAIFGTNEPCPGR